MLPVRSQSPSRQKPYLKLFQGLKLAPGSILIIEQGETLPQVVLRTEAYSQLNPNHRVGGNLTSNYSKDKACFPVKSQSLGIHFPLNIQARHQIQFLLLKWTQAWCQFLPKHRKPIHSKASESGPYHQSETSLD